VIDSMCACDVHRALYIAYFDAYRVRIGNANGAWGSRGGVQ